MPRGRPGPCRVASRRMDSAAESTRRDAHDGVAASAEAADRLSAPGFRYLLLYRHGKTADTPGRAERDRALSDVGAGQVQQVSRRLAEHIGLGRDVRAVRAVLHGNYRQIRQTGGLIRQAMSAEHLPWPEAAALNSPCLDPARFWTEDQGVWRNRIKRSDPASDNPRAPDRRARAATRLDRGRADAAARSPIPAGSHGALGRRPVPRAGQGLVAARPAPLGDRAHRRDDRRPDPGTSSSPKWTSRRCSAA
jgi:hypothetical protein